MDPVGAAIRLSKTVSPALMARLQWMRRARRGDISLRVMESLVEAGGVAVDIGAGWGLYSWALARLVGPRGHVHAFEPNPVDAEVLRALQRRRPNISVHQLALADHAGEAQLYVPIFEGKRVEALASLSIPPEHAEIEHEVVSTPVERLDSVLAEEHSRISFVKCDVEGHELAVLRGAAGTLERWKPALLVEIEQRHGEADIRDTFGYLGDLGYRGWSIGADGLRPVEEFDLERDQLSFLGEEPMLYEMPPGYVHDFVFVHSSAVSADLPWATE